jgi:S1 RNA binding domain protein
MSLEIGVIVEGVVTGITNFGAFVRLPEGNTGLIHISEVANTYVKDINQYLKEKDTVFVKVIGLNNKGKYDLSLKQVETEAGSVNDGTQSQTNEEIDDFDKDEEKMQEDRREVHHYKQKTQNYGYPGYHDDRKEKQHENKGFSFEDKLSRFLKQSEERLLDIKRNTEAKRGRKR